MTKKSFDERNYSLLRQVERILNGNRRFRLTAEQKETFERDRAALIAVRLQRQLETFDIN